MNGAPAACCEFVFAITLSDGLPVDKGERRKGYCALTEEGADIPIIESRKDEKKFLSASSDIQLCC
jgi:hypothetical protein